MTAVIDTSVALKWVIDEDGSEAARELLLGEALAASDLIIVECANVLWAKAMCCGKRKDAARSTEILRARPSRRSLPLRSTCCRPRAMSPPLRRSSSIWTDGIRQPLSRSRARRARDAVYSRQRFCRRRSPPRAVWGSRKAHRHLGAGRLCCVSRREGDWCRGARRVHPSHVGTPRIIAHALRQRRARAHVSAAKIGPRRAGRERWPPSPPATWSAILLEPTLPKAEARRRRARGDAFRTPAARCQSEQDFATGAPRPLLARLGIRRSKETAQPAKYSARITLRRNANLTAPSSVFLMTYVTISQQPREIFPNNAERF